MSERRIDYWREALEMALDERGLAGTISATDLAYIADSLATSAENESMATAPVSNPLSGEVDRLKRARIEDGKEADRLLRDRDATIEELRHTVRRLSYELETARRMIA